MKKLFTLIALAASLNAAAQSADWTRVIWREPQVRYLLSDMTLNGGKTDLYRKYATEEQDPDSREAIRLWDAGVRVVNTNDFERRWLTNQFAKDGKMLRIVLRGSNRTITGNEVVLSNDGTFAQGPMRLAMLDLTLGAPVRAYEKRAKHEPAVAEALRRFKDGGRAINAHLFANGGTGTKGPLKYAGSGLPADGARVQLNTDLPYPEVNARYFLADICLGGSRDFYARAAETAHEKGCEEAVLRFDQGVKIMNLEQLERKKVNGQTLITRKGSNDRISGSEVKLSTD